MRFHTGSDLLIEDALLENHFKEGLAVFGDGRLVTSELLGQKMSRSVKPRIQVCLLLKECAHQSQILLAKEVRIGHKLIHLLTSARILL